VMSADEKVLEFVPKRKKKLNLSASPNFSP
jgi:hypothetical protein